MYQRRCTFLGCKSPVPPTIFHPSSTKDFEAFVRWRIPTQTDSNTAGIMALTSEDVRLFFWHFVSAGVKKVISRELTYTI